MVVRWWTRKCAPGPGYVLFLSLALAQLLAGCAGRPLWRDTVGDTRIEILFEGTDSEQFPHILGRIHPSAVLQAHKIFREDNGRFISVEDVINGGNAVS